MPTSGHNRIEKDGQDFFMFHEKLPVNTPWKIIKLDKSMKDIEKETAEAFEPLF